MGELKKKFHNLASMKLESALISGNWCHYKVYGCCNVWQIKLTKTVVINLITSVSLFL